MAHSFTPVKAPSNPTAQNAPSPKKAVELDPLGTVAGMTQRLLLAECTSPGKVGVYKEADARESMQLMFLVLNNRLKNKPSQYNAKGAKTLLDIIKAPGQFAGFSRESIDSHIVKNINETLRIANTEKDPRHDKYLKYVQMAQEIANAPPIQDPSGGVLAFWRTADSGAPTSGAKEYKTIMNNTFYY